LELTQDFTSEFTADAQHICGRTPSNYTAPMNRRLKLGHLPENVSEVCSICNFGVNGLSDC
jgi:hypothetical protein